MKDFTFKALIVFIIVLVSGLILFPILRPDFDNVGGNGGNYELLVDNELMAFEELDGYGINFDNRDYQIILVSIYSLELKASIVQNMILNEFDAPLDNVQLLNIPNIQALAGYVDNGIMILAEYIGDLKITVWGVSK